MPRGERSGHCHKIFTSAARSVLVLPPAPSSHSLALVTPGSPTHYLDPEDRILSVKAGAPPTSMFVLCVHMPGAALLEVMNSLRQNVSPTA